jgi:hypothetical protein
MGRMLGSKRWWSRYAYWPTIVNGKIIWRKWYEVEVERCRVPASENQTYLKDHAGNKWHHYWKLTGEKRSCEQPAKLDKMAWPY